MTELNDRDLWGADALLPPARRVSLYLKIARRLRPYEQARHVRRAAVAIAWEARCELREGNDALVATHDPDATGGGR